MSAGIILSLRRAEQSAVPGERRIGGESAVAGLSCCQRDAVEHACGGVFKSHELFGEVTRIVRMERPSCFAVVHKHCGSALIGNEGGEIGGHRFKYGQA